MSRIFKYLSVVLLPQYLVLAALGPSIQPLHEMLRAGFRLQDVDVVVHSHGHGSHLHVHVRPAGSMAAEATANEAHSQQGRWATNEDWHAPHDCALLGLVSRLGLASQCDPVRVPLLSETRGGYCGLFLWQRSVLAKCNLCRGPPVARIADVRVLFVCIRPSLCE